MRSRVHAILFIAFLITTSVLGQSAPLTFRAALTAANVVNPAGSTGGFGSATLSINGNQGTLDLVTIGVSNITDVSLDLGAAGVNGPLIAAFTDSFNAVVNGRFHRTIPLDPGNINAIAANPQGFYLVVTTSSGNPGGAIRGQLSDANTIYFGGTISGYGCDGGKGRASGVGSFVFALTPDVGSATYTVRYDMLTNNLGGTISALQVGDVLGGQAVFVIASNVTSTNGRFAGTSQITAARARFLQTMPAGIHLTVTIPDFGVDCAAAGPILPARELFIPVAGSVHGLGNTNYMTDVNLFNNSATGGQADILMQFFPTGGSTAAAQAIAWSTLLPRSTATLRDVTNSGFNGSINGIGALRMITTESAFASARIYNDLTSTGGGTFGQFAAGLPRSSALTEGTLVGLPNIVSGGAGASNGSGNARTNIGFFNPSESATTVALEMRDASGAVIGQRQLTLMPWMQVQMPLTGSSGLFTAVNANVTNSSVYFLSGAPVFVYASVIDNPTGDASYVTPGTSGSGGTGAGS